MKRRDGSSTPKIFTIQNNIVFSRSPIVFVNIYSSSYAQFISSIIAFKSKASLYRKGFLRWTNLNSFSISLHKSAAISYSYISLLNVLCQTDRTISLHSNIYNIKINTFRNSSQFEKIKSSEKRENILLKYRLWKFMAIRLFFICYIITTFNLYHILFIKFKSDALFNRIILLK